MTATTTTTSGEGGYKRKHFVSAEINPAETKQLCRQLPNRRRPPPLSRALPLSLAPPPPPPSPLLPGATASAIAPPTARRSSRPRAHRLPPSPPALSATALSATAAAYARPPLSGRLLAVRRASPLCRLPATLTSAANQTADALAQKLEQSEAARKKAELAASKAKVEADEAKAKAAGVEELQKKLEDATAALDEHKAAQASRDEGILKRLKSQSRRTLTQTNQDFDLDNPVNDPLLDALSLLEFHGREIREGVANANAGLSALFPYFFPKKEEPATFLNLAKMFNASEDLGLKMRQENMKVVCREYSLPRLPIANGRLIG
nr:uncharacterized protein LOC127310130 [Lolium perenne]